MYACSIGIDGCPLLQLRLCGGRLNPVGGSHGGRSRSLFVGLGLMTDGLEPPHEVWDVLSQAHD
jgi:hypothetical protein